MTFFFPLIGLICGLLAAQYVSSVWLSLVPIGCGLLLYSLYFSGKNNPQFAFRFRHIHYIWIFSIFCGLGMADSFFHRPTLLPANHGNLFFTGIIDRCDEKAEGDNFIVNIKKITDEEGKKLPRANTSILIHTDGFTAQKGDIISFKTSPTLFSAYKGNKKYGDSNIKKGILYYSSVPSEKIIKEGRTENLFTYSDDIRTNLEIKIEKSSLQRNTGDFIIALLLGDRYFLDSNIKEIFSNAGMAHALALSGMHVGIILSFLLILLMPFSLLGKNNWRYFIAIILLWGYIMISGFSLSAVRAAIMATITVGAYFLQRKNSSLNALLIAAFIILLFDSKALYDVGWQLSFICVALILLFADKFNFMGHHEHPLLFKLTSCFIISLITSLGMWVLIAYYFGNVPLLFLPANILLLPLLPVFMLLSLIFILFLSTGIDLSFLSKLLDSGYELLVRLADFFSGYGNYTLKINISLPIVFLWLAGILFLAILLNFKRKKLMTCGAIICFASALLLIPILSEEPKPKIVLSQHYSSFKADFHFGSDVFRHNFKEYSTSRLTKGNVEMLAISCHIDSLDIKKLNISETTKRKFLMIGKGAKLADLMKVPGIENCEKIIIHSFFKERMDEIPFDIISENKIYWIKEYGPLEIEV